MPDTIAHPATDLARISPRLGGVCREYLERYRAFTIAAVRAGRGGVEVAHQFSRILDGLLGALYCASDAAARSNGLAPRGRTALVAVGGYGRGRVGPHSDVDVIFLCDDPSDPFVASVAEGVLYPIWDLSMEIGHVVRGVEETLELARNDIRTGTTLLDLRRVAGSEEIVRDLRRDARRQVLEPHLGEFLDALVADTESRHERFGGSLFLLEPEVKLGRGGLRDIDVAEWAVGARWGVSGSSKEYVKCGALLAREVDELEQAREFLWRVRNYLHVRAGRRRDRLTFADQEEIATDLGFEDGFTLAVEACMQTYYRHARNLAQMAERIVERARPVSRRSRANIQSNGDGTMMFDGFVTLEDSDRLSAEPDLALRLYLHVAANQGAPYSFARDAVARNAVDEHWRSRLRGSESAARVFCKLLCSVPRAPVRRGSILSELHEVGLMLAMLPEFEPVTGRVQYDMYNVYTVDVHSVAAVDALRAMMQGAELKRFPLASRLAAETPRPEPLFLAVLLHEIGKATGRDDPRRGAEIARAIAKRLFFSDGDADHVAWLVLEAMSLYHWATRRDTNDPDVIDELIRRVQTSDRLRDLYLLTICDLLATNPAAVTAWRIHVLDELYLVLASALEGEEPFTTEGRVHRIRAEVGVAFVGDKGADQLAAFVRDMPDRYLLGNPVDSIRMHARAARDRGADAVRLVFGPGPSEEIAELLLITDDRPGLLADAAAVLSAHRLEIVGAQIYTRPRADRAPEAFDVFHVRRASKADAGLDGRRVAEIERDMQALLEGRLTTGQLAARNTGAPSWSQRRRPDVFTEVTVDNEASARFTVVDVRARDRVGLLSVLARTLHELGLTIALSKINTEGNRALDVFYVLDAGGQKVREAERLAAIQARMMEAIDAFQGDGAPSDQ